MSIIKEIFQGKISIEYSPATEPGHYELTPYSFRPRVAKRMVASSYYDLGQGILDVIHEAYSKSVKNGKDISIIQKMLDLEHP